MDRPKELVEYRALALEKNKIEAKLTKLKPAVRKILDEVGDFNDLHLQKVVKTKWHTDVMYDWIIETYPQYANQVITYVVDLEEFGKLTKLGLINIALVPDYCSSDSIEWHIKTTNKKEEETDETN